MADKAQLHVTDIKQHIESEPNGEGQFHDVAHVHFTTPSGTRAHIKMPMSHYTAPNVAAAIHHAASHIEQVHALEGQPLTPAAE